MISHKQRLVAKEHIATYTNLIHLLNTQIVIVTSKDHDINIHLLCSSQTVAILASLKLHAAITLFVSRPAKINHGCAN